jgi:hypothetical protein
LGNRFFGLLHRGNGAFQIGLIQLLRCLSGGLLRLAGSRRGAGFANLSQVSSDLFLLLDQLVQ